MKPIDMPSNGLLQYIEYNNDGCGDRFQYKIAPV
jgi:hypothetical protein